MTGSQLRRRRLPCLNLGGIVQSGSLKRRRPGLPPILSTVICRSRISSLLQPDLCGMMWARTVLSVCRGFWSAFTLRWSMFGHGRRAHQTRLKRPKLLPMLLSRLLRLIEESPLHLLVVRYRRLSLCLFLMT